MPDASKIDVVCFGGGDWWYHNQAHIDMQIMRRFARLGTTLYVNSIIMQKPSFRINSRFFEKIVRKFRSITRGVRESGEGFVAYSPFPLPFQQFTLLRCINDRMVQVQINMVQRKLYIHNPIVWVACPPACEVAVNMRKRKLVYQRTDRLEEYPNVATAVVMEQDRKLKAEADLTIFVNQSLYEAEAAQCKNAMYLDHGVDYEFFANASDSPQIPADMRYVKPPVIGFFGGIDDHTSDIELLLKVIDLLPEASFVFIGTASINCDELLARPNVKMLGQKPYNQIAHYGKCFDVAIMPWRQSRWIEGCNPIKLKEYMALGKPIVSTPFSELKKYDGLVYEAASAVEFAECINTAMREDGHKMMAARKASVRDDTWDRKAQQVLDALFEKDSVAVNIQKRV